MHPTFPLAPMTVEELAERLQDSDRPLQLIDVRERAEVAIVKLDQFAVYPFSEYAEWSDRLPASLEPDIETIVLCHHGIRSAQMCQWLSQQGFSNVKNVVGGIDAYAVLVDPTLARY